MTGVILGLSRLVPTASEGSYQVHIGITFNEIPRLVARISECDRKHEALGIYKDEV